MDLLKGLKDKVDEVLEKTDIDDKIKDGVAGLKDKVDATLVSGDIEDIVAVSEPQSDNAEEAVKALLVLGYSRSQAKSAVAQTDAAAPVEEIVRAALRLLMK